MTDQPKWTKGPWAGKGQTSEDDVFCGTMHRICADGAWLAFVPTWKDNPDEASEAEANARLIAAAPDMYAALEAIRDNEVVRAICPSPLWGKMADAMIKARGETK